MVKLKWQEKFGGDFLAYHKGVQFRITRGRGKNKGWYGFIQDDHACACRTLADAQSTIEDIFNKAAPEYLERWGVKRAGG